MEVYGIVIVYWRTVASVLDLLNWRAVRVYNKEGYDDV
jgi:hypothetical protein